MARLDAGVVYPFAAAAFASLWLLFAQTAPIWHEVVSVYPEPAAPMIAEPTDADPGPTYLPGCADPGPTRLVATNMRPQVALCVGERQYPLQIMSYASGVPYWISDLFWPLHRGRVFRLRAAGLILGLLTIVVVRRLLVRFGDETTANLAALFLAVSPPFLWTYASLLHYEVLPWLACAAAIDQLARCDGLAAGRARGNVPTARVAAAGALLGLAVLANLKAVFLIAPLVLFALRAGVRLSAVGPAQWGLAALLFAAVLSPSLLGNTLTAGADLSHQLATRSRTLVAQLDPLKIAAEIPNLALFWGDTLALLPLISGKPVWPAIPGVLVALLSFLHCAYAAVAYFWRGRGALVPAACGAVFLSFILVSALLYDFAASGNYIPLAGVFGIATAASVTGGARALAARFGWPERRTLAALAAAVVAAMCWSIFGRGTPAHIATLSINAVAERDLGHYLSAHAEPGVPLLVTTYVLAGVTEAVTGGEVRTIKAHPYLNCGFGRGSFDGIDDEARARGRACLLERFGRLLRAFPDATRFLLPIESTPIDDALAGELGRALEDVAAGERRMVREEATFSGLRTGPVLRLVRVEPASVE